MRKQRSKNEQQKAAEMVSPDEGLTAVYLWEMRDAPVSTLLLGDAQSYDAWAQEISSGNWFGDRVFYQAPLYPYFLALIYTFLGRDFFIVRIIQVAIGTASCLFLARAGRYFFSKKTGVISGILIALYPTAIFFDCLIQKAVLGFFFMSVFLYLAGKTIHNPKGLWWILMGMILGCMGLTRENALILIVVILFWIYVYFRTMPFKKTVAWGALLVCGLAIILIPVGLRNKIVGGDFVLTTSQFGSNLYIGNNNMSDGRYRPLRPDRGDWRFERQDATELAEEAIGRKLSPSEVSQYWVGQTVSYIRAEPMQWIGLLVKKWHLVWNALEVGDAESQYAHYKWSFALKWLGFFFHFGVICPLAVFGICLPMIGVVGLFAAAGITGSREFFREKNTKHILVCLLLVFISAILVNWKIFNKEEFTASTYYNIAHDLSVQ
ncbi:MAG: glycosyltransferase family 39 protein, partial [Deltaproteobacteria bacterium]|nr:glycosyltransferase family 39 protein [Deltaproteobacteria bacterium]